jgi:putative ABC transport system ATP-binding protein
MEMMHRFSRQSGKTIVIVSHDPDAAAWADHIITLKDGNIVEETWNQHTEHKND